MSEKRIVWREVGDETVVLDLRTSRYLRLNHTGTILWRGLRRGVSRDALASTLVDAFGIGRDRAVADVAAFTRDLEAQGLLTTVERA